MRKIPDQAAESGAEAFRETTTSVRRSNLTRLSDIEDFDRLDLWEEAIQE